MLNLFNSPDKKLKSELFKLLKDKINEWESTDIYAISLYVESECDNPFDTTVTLGFNTEANFQNNISRAWDEQEARWNYAFWIQNQELVFGIGETKECFKKWLVDKGYGYYSYDELYSCDNSDKLCEIGEKAFADFIKILITVVQEFHSCGYIRKKFGHEIPILIHELEYYEKIATQNIEANTQELVADFVKFCRGE
ncbi:MAG: hypothetical protein IJ002_05870 [Clostridia bacterium]|nr:hypothetical protein [Clostridia bacterium]